MTRKPSCPRLAPWWGLSLALLAMLCGSAANWPSFRGPDGSGASADTGLPTTWSDTENVVWKTDLPGPGGSCPITWGDRVYLTCYTGYGLDENNPGDADNLVRHLLCLNRADGTLVWNQPVAAATPETNYRGFQALHGYASSTPACDGERIYAFFGRTGVFAFDLEGKQLWSADVGTGTHGWGSATSPVLYKNLVIINANVESRSLVALDRETGKEVWQAPGMKSTWNTPILVKLADGKTELVVSVQGSVLGFDPDTGEQLWNCAGITDYVCPSVVEANGVVYAIGGRRKQSLAVKAGGRGDVTETHKLWEQKAGSNVASPVVVDDRLYWISDSGIAFCLKCSDGEILFEQRLPARSVYASMVAADGKLYSVSRERGTFVLAASPEFKELAHNTLESDTSIFNASPAVSNGQLLLRSDKAIYCIGKK